MDISSDSSGYENFSNSSNSFSSTTDSSARASFVHANSAFASPLRSKVAATFKSPTSKVASDLAKVTLFSPTKRSISFASLNAIEESSPKRLKGSDSLPIDNRSVCLSEFENEDFSHFSFVTPTNICGESTFREVATISPLTRVNVAMHDSAVHDASQPALEVSKTFVYCPETDTYDVECDDGHVYKNVTIKPINGDPESDIFQCTLGQDQYYIKPGAKRCDEHSALCVISELLGLKEPIAAVEAVSIKEFAHPHSFTLYDTRVVEADEESWGPSAGIFSLQKSLKSMPFSQLEQRRKDELLFTCIALGINDVKIQDIVFDQIVDVEECMVTNPKGQAFSHLPLLAEDSFHQPIAKESFQYFKNIVSAWDIEDICSDVKEFVPEYFNESEAFCLDIQRFCTLIEPDSPTLFPGIEKKTDPLFCEERVCALKKRLEVIKNFFLQQPCQEKLSLCDLAMTVDPAFKASFLKRSPQNITPLKEKLQNKKRVLEQQIQRLRATFPQKEGESKKGYKKRVALHKKECKVQIAPLEKAQQEISMMEYSLLRMTDGKRNIFGTCGSRDSHFDQLLQQITKTLS